MYTTNREYLNKLQDRYETVHSVLWWKDKYVIIDLCAGDGGLSKYYDKYYWCDIEPAGDSVEECADNKFIDREFPDWDKLLTVFWYGGRAWLEKLTEKQIYDSELDIESSTLDDSIQKMLPNVRYFVLEWTSLYVNWYIEKYWLGNVIYKRYTRSDLRTLDRLLYIIDVHNIWGDIWKIPTGS